VANRESTFSLKKPFKLLHEGAVEGLNGKKL